MPAADYDPDTDPALWGHPTALVTAEDLFTAQKVLVARYPHTVLRTPLAPCHLVERLRERNPKLPADGRVYLKLENMQATGSFKVRGMQYKMHKILETPANALKDIGVLTFSAGNAGRAVAFLAKANCIPATIYLPDTVPEDRITLLESLGATCRRVPGQTLLAEASACLAKEGQTLIHPFDDLDIIAGHGSCGLEILAQMREILATTDAASSPPIDEVYVCCGGGGLCSGVAAAVKLCVAAVFGEGTPAPKVYAVEPEGANSMHLSVAAGKPCWTNLDGEKGKTRTAAHGLAPPFAGKSCYNHIKHFADGVVLVSDDELKAATRFLYRECGIVSEVSGAAAVAAVTQKYRDADTMPKNIVCLVSGRNIDPEMLREVVTGAQ